MGASLILDAVRPRKFQIVHEPGRNRYNSPVDQELWTSLDRYIADRLLAPDPALDAAQAAETRVSATTIQTVGSKGYDGFTLARVN